MQQKVKLSIGNLRNQPCTPIIPVILEPAEIWGYITSWFRRLGVTGWCFRRNWFLESAQCPGDLGLTNLPVNLKINVLENWHLSVAVVTHTALRSWTRTSLVILRTSTLREVMPKAMSKLDKVGMRDLRSSTMNCEWKDQWDISLSRGSLGDFSFLTWHTHWEQKTG